MTTLEQVHAKRLLEQMRQSIDQTLGSTTDEARDVLVQSLRDTTNRYLDQLRDNKAIVSHQVVCGSPTSTVILRDRQNLPWWRQQHCAGIHYTDGVAPRFVVYKGKWRKAKKLLRYWLRTNLQCLAIDLSIKPVQPVEYLVVCDKTNNTDKDIQAGVLNVDFVSKGASALGGANLD